MAALRDRAVEEGLALGTVASERTQLGSDGYATVRRRAREVLEAAARAGGLL